jgi:hypothetical protein
MTNRLSGCPTLQPAATGTWIASASTAIVRKYLLSAICYLSFGLKGRANYECLTKAKAAGFHQLHHADQILVLPNCWDVLSAVVLKAAGAKAIATTSAGLAWDHRYADGEKLPVDKQRSLPAVARFGSVRLTRQSPRLTPLHTLAERARGDQMPSTSPRSLSE